MLITTVLPRAYSHNPYIIYVDNIQVHALVSFKMLLSGLEEMR